MIKGIEIFDVKRKNLAEKYSSHFLIHYLRVQREKFNVFKILFLFLNRHNDNTNGESYKPKFSLPNDSDYWDSSCLFTCIYSFLCCI